MNIREKNKIIKEFNENKFQVLIISRSGMEGLDLKEVRNVILMDPVWNYSGINQIKGRAIRYNLILNYQNQKEKLMCII